MSLNRILSEYNNDELNNTYLYPRRDMIRSLNKSSCPSPSGLQRRQSKTTYQPSCNHYVTDTKHVFIIDLPGLLKEDITVDIKDSKFIVVSGTRSSEIDESKDIYVYKESYYGSFCESLRLPENVVLNSVKSNLKNGVLQIVFDKILNTQNSVNLSVKIE